MPVPVKDIVNAIMVAIYEFYWGAPRAIALPDYNQENPSLLALEYSRLVANHKRFSQDIERRWLFGLGVSLCKASYEWSILYPNKSSGDVQKDMAIFGNNLNIPPLAVTQAITIWTIFEKAPILMDQLGDIPNYYFYRMNKDQVKEICQYLEATLNHYHEYNQTQVSEEEEVPAWQDNWPPELTDDDSSSGESSDCLDNFEGYDHSD
jgi:hypothetical protein